MERMFFCLLLLVSIIKMKALISNFYCIFNCAFLYTVGSSSLCDITVTGSRASQDTIGSIGSC